MEELTHDLSDRALIQAADNNFVELFKLFQLLPGAVLQEEDGIVSFYTGVPVALFNGVTRTRLEAGTSENRIAETLAYFAERGTPMTWYRNSLSEPPDLAAILEARGLHTGDVMPVMAADMQTLERDEPLPPGLSIKRVGDEKALDEMNSVIAAGFGIPDALVEPFSAVFAAPWLEEGAPLQHFLAALDGRAVASSTVAMLAGVAGIYNVATLEDARGRGVGRAVTRAAMLHARNRGYRAAVLQSSHLGYSVYHKLGFREIDTLYEHVWVPETVQEN